MSDYKDVLSSARGWIHELARAEVHPDAERILNLASNQDPQQLVEESSIEFLGELRQHFVDFGRVFNGFSEEGKKFAPVKVYSIAQTAADFMVFRNQVKLIVSNSAHGVLQFTFAKHNTNSIFKKSDDEKPSSRELVAQMGPFRDVHWTFEGEKVSAAQVAKFYFAEFIRATRDVARSRGGNQALLEQVKALLQEKGLDI